jgi:hypothetical protein
VSQRQLPLLLLLWPCARGQREQAAKGAVRLGGGRARGGVAGLQGLRVASCLQAAT